MTKRPVLILGGSSDIGLAIARRFATEGYPIQLAARRPDELEPERTDISLRHNVEVTLHRFDALEIDRVEAFYDDLPEMPGIVVCAVGLLGDQAEAERNPQHARMVAETNFIGPTVAVEAAARRLTQLDEDTAIIGISSVAGDRGRAKNYWYGASKAAFTATLSGLRQKYHQTRLQVTTIKPGYVRTKMTSNVPMPDILATQPQTIAKSVLHSSLQKKNIEYGSLIWRMISLIVVHIPESLFRKMNF